MHPLGPFDELKASGRLDALIRSGLRHCENFAESRLVPGTLRRMGSSADESTGRQTLACITVSASRYKIR